MSRKRKWSDDQIIKAVETSRSLNQVLVKLGVKSCGGGTYYSVRNSIERLRLNTSHFTGQHWNKGGTNWSKKPLSSYLVLGKKVDSYILKNRLITEGKWKNCCHICGQPPIWNGKKLCLQLDHMNGDHLDNRIENIRLACPNCHSQTENFAGRRLRKHKKSADLAWRRKPRPHKRKVERPSRTELAEMLTVEPILRIAKRYGVTDNAVRKWAKWYGLNCRKIRRSGVIAAAQDSESCGRKTVEVQVLSPTPKCQG